MKKRVSSFFRYAFLIIVSLFSIFPIVWMIIAATNESKIALKGTLIPGVHLFENFKKLLEQQNLWGALKNSFVNAIVLTFLALIICSIAGYGFEVYHSKGKDRLMSVLLLAMMVPFAATMIPLFQMFSNMKSLSAMWVIILPTISTPFLIMMFRQGARSFPHDIIEAARIDGLNELQIFFRMFIPTMASTYAAAMTVTFMNAWNSYLWPSVMVKNNVDLTMPMLITNLTAGYLTDYGVLMVAVLICTLPTVIVFFILQRNFTDGIMGAVK